MSEKALALLILLYKILQEERGILEDVKEVVKWQYLEICVTATFAEKMLDSVRTQDKDSLMILGNKLLEACDDIHRSREQRNPIGHTESNREASG